MRFSAKASWLSSFLLHLPVYISALLTTDSDPCHTRVKVYPEYERSRGLHKVCSCCGSFCRFCDSKIVMLATPVYCLFTLAPEPYPTVRLLGGPSSVTLTHGLRSPATELRKVAYRCSARLAHSDRKVAPHVNVADHCDRVTLARSRSETRELPRSETRELPRETSSCVDRACFVVVTTV